MTLPRPRLERGPAVEPGVRQQQRLHVVAAFMVGRQGALCKPYTLKNIRYGHFTQQRLSVEAGGRQDVPLTKSRGWELQRLNNTWLPLILSTTGRAAHLPVFNLKLLNCPAYTWHLMNRDIGPTGGGTAACLNSEPGFYYTFTQTTFCQSSCTSSLCSSLLCVIIF